MATLEQCERALASLAERLDKAAEHGSRPSSADRTLSCRITDLEVIFSGRLKDGRLVEIGQAKSDRAKVKLTMSSDDLVSLVDGSLRLASAWAGGRVKVDASIADMVRLRGLF